MPPVEHPAFVPSHVGICVADGQRARRFYEDGLGFQAGAMIEVDDGFENLVGLHAPLAMKCQFLRLADLVIELIEVASQLAERPARPRPINRTGFTHLSFRVDNVMARAEELVKFGGSILPETYTRDEAHGGHLLFCLDPDGNRIELMSYPSDVQFA